MKAKIHITLKSGVLDPQGKAIQNALTNLGFEGVNEVRQGKYLEIDLNQTDPDRAKTQAEKMCEALLANTVNENFKVEVV